jgi:hypothetical protein
MASVGRVVALLALLAGALARFVSEEQLRQAFPGTPAISLVELVRGRDVGCWLPIGRTQEADPTAAPAPALPVCGLQGKGNKDSLEPVEVIPDTADNACTIFRGLGTLLKHYTRGSLTKLSVNQLQQLLDRTQKVPKPISRKSVKVLITHERSGY